MRKLLRGKWNPAHRYKERSGFSFKSKPLYYQWAVLPIIFLPRWLFRTNSAQITEWLDHRVLPPQLVLAVGSGACTGYHGNQATALSVTRQSAKNSIISYASVCQRSREQMLLLKKHRSSNRGRGLACASDKPFRDYGKRKCVTHWRLKPLLCGPIKPVT